jgi:hypothetical protein
VKSASILAVFLALFSGWALSDALQSGAAASDGVSAQRLVNADNEPGNWLTRGRT